MSDVFLNVLPIFVLILTGWLIVRLGYLKACPLFPALSGKTGSLRCRSCSPSICRS